MRLRAFVHRLNVNNAGHTVKSNHQVTQQHQIKSQFISSTRTIATHSTSWNRVSMHRKYNIKMTILRYVLDFLRSYRSNSLLTESCVMSFPSRIRRTLWSTARRPTYDAGDAATVIMTLSAGCTVPLGHDTDTCRSISFKH